MSLSLNLDKAAESLQLDLQKRGIVNVEAEVCFDFDVSGSYEDEHKDGSTQKLLERLVPIAMVFDPDKQMDMFTFSNGENNAHHVGTVNLTNLDGYVRREIIRQVPGWCGGTDYAPVLRKNLEKFGWLQPGAAAHQKTGGMFSGMFGGRSAAPAPSTTPVAKRKSIVIFNTDGDNDPNNQSGDKNNVRRLLEESERRKDEIYFLFIAYANGGGRFPFLQEIGDRFSNTGLITIDNIDRWCAQSNETINGLLLGDELVTWLKKR